MNNPFWNPLPVKVCKLVDQVKVLDYSTLDKILAEDCKVELSSAGMHCCWSRCCFLHGSLGASSNGVLVVVNWISVRGGQHLADSIDGTRCALMPLQM